MKKYSIWALLAMFIGPVALLVAFLVLVVHRW